MNTMRMHERQRTAHRTHMQCSAEACDLIDPPVLSCALHCVCTCAVLCAVCCVCSTTSPFVRLHRARRLGVGSRCSAACLSASSDITGTGACPPSTCMRPQPKRNRKRRRLRQRRQRRQAIGLFSRTTLCPAYTNPNEPTADAAGGDSTSHSLERLFDSVRSLPLCSVCTHC
jgi:hypothetical protein